MSMNVPAVRFETAGGGQTASSRPRPALGVGLTLIIPPGTVRLQRLTAALEGAPFSESENLLDQMDITVTGEKNSFVLDLHRPVAIRQVTVTGDTGVKVYPWAGIQFADAPVTGEVLAQKLKVITTGNPLTLAKFRENLMLTCASAPSNIKVMLEGQPPFFFHAGGLIGTLAIPDFAAEVNRWLQAREEAGTQGATVRLIVESDTPGSLRVKPDPPVYAVTLDAGLPASADRVLTAEPGEPVTVPLQAPFTDLPVTARLSSVQVTLAGETESDLLDAGLAGQRGAYALLLSPSVSAAQPVTPGLDLRCTGVHLHLGGEAESCTVQVELREAQGDQPGPEPLTSAAVTVPAGAASGWVRAEWERPALLRRGVMLFLVVRSRRGQAVWEAQALEDGAGLLYSRDDGLIWHRQMAGDLSLAGQFKLMYRPDKLQPAPALRVVLEAGGQDVAEAAMTPASQAELVELRPASAPKVIGGLRVRLEPQAAGRLRLQAARIEVTVNDQGSASHG